MSGYSINIEQKTLEGNNFREVLYTTQRSQLVIMTLQPGDRPIMRGSMPDQLIQRPTGGLAVDAAAAKDTLALVLPNGGDPQVTER